MPVCAIRDCKVNKLKSPNVAFHQFPDDPEFRQVWMDLSDCTEYSSDLLLCSSHFKPPDFIGENLKPDAIPSQNLDTEVTIFYNYSDQNAKNTEYLKVKKEDEEDETNETEKFSEGEEEMAEVGQSEVVDEEDEAEKNVESVDEERIIISDIVMTIVYSLDLLIKSDSDKNRSKTVKEEIAAVLYRYNQYIDDEQIHSVLQECYEQCSKNEKAENMNVDPSTKVEVEYLDQEFLSDYEEGELVDNKTLKKNVPAITMSVTIGPQLKKKRKVEPLPPFKVYKPRMPFTGERFMCDICELTLVSEHYLTVHQQACRRRHVYAGNPQLETHWQDMSCPLCKSTCTHRGNLIRHFITHRVKDLQESLLPFKIKKCNTDDPEANIEMLIDFITDFETKESMDKADEGTTELDLKYDLHLPDKPCISDYLKFNLKNIIFDLEVNRGLYCMSCNIVFDTKEALDEHQMKANQTDAFVCNYCDETSETPWKLAAHTKLHAGIYDPDSLYLHIKPDDVDECPAQIDYKIYVCKYCLLLFVQEHALQSHMIEYEKFKTCPVKHGKGMKRRPQVVKKRKDGKFPCTNCDKAYKSYSILMEHMETHSLTKNYHCECGKVFFTKYRLQHHITVTHNKKIVSKVCELCGTSVLHSNLRRHMMVHSDVRPYKCNFCTQSFKYKDALTIHYRTHTKERPWKCEYCGAGFSEKRAYSVHINIHEGKTPYQCDKCSESFVSKAKLNKHMLDHKNEILP